MGDPHRPPKIMEFQPTPELNKALAKAKADFPKILENKRVKIPTKTGREIQFTYSELEEIAEAVTPSLSGYGLVLVSQTVFLEDGKFCLVTTLRHESGESIASYFLLPSDPNTDPKELGSRISYGRRYNTICLLEITTIEPSNSEQRTEQVRKLAKDIKTEAGIASKPQAPPKKGDTSFIDAIEGYKPLPPANKTEPAQDLYPANNDIVRQIRSRTKHEPAWVIAQCKHYGYERPGAMPPESLEKLIADMCVDWAVSSGVIGDRQQAYTSIQGAISFASSAGQPLVEATLSWLNRHQSAVSV